MTPHEIISACLIGLAISAVINSVVLIRLIGNVERLERPAEDAERKRLNAEDARRRTLARRFHQGGFPSL